MKIAVIIIGILLLSTVQSSLEEGQCKNPVGSKFELPEDIDFQHSKFTDLTIDLKDFKGQEKFRFPTMHSKYIQDLVVVNENTIISIGMDDKLIFWDLETQKEKGIFENFHKSVAIGLIFRENILVTSGVGLKFFNIIKEENGNYKIEEFQFIQDAHELDITKLFEYGKSGFLSLSVDNEIRHWIFNEDTKLFEQDLKVQEFYFDDEINNMSDAVIAQDKKSFITSHIGRNLNIVDILNQEISETFKTNSQQAYTNTMLIWDERIVLAGLWSHISFWDYNNGFEIANVKECHSNWLQKIIKIGGDYILSTAEDKEVNIWKVVITYDKDNDPKGADLQFIRSLSGNTNSVLEAIVAPGNLIITGSFDSQIIVYH